MNHINKFFLNQFKRKKINKLPSVPPSCEQWEGLAPPTNPH